MPVARQKLERKGADLIVANFDSDQNEVLVIARDGAVTRLAKATKHVLADRILDLARERR